MKSKLKIAAIIQARMTSSRLPAKVMLPLGRRTILENVLCRVAEIPEVDCLCVAIPEGDAHIEIQKTVEKLAQNFPKSLSCIQQSEDDVLSRTLYAAKSVKADVVVRITSDCPFVDPDISSLLIKNFLWAGVPYARLDSEKGYPLGFDTEVIELAALTDASRGHPDSFEKEHVTPYIWRRPQQFPGIVISCVPDHRNLRLVIDEEKDYEFAKKIYSLLETVNPEFRYADILKVIEDNPNLLEINNAVQQKAMIGKS